MQVSVYWYCDSLWLWNFSGSCWLSMKKSEKNLVKKSSHGIWPYVLFFVFLLSRYNDFQIFLDVVWCPNTFCITLHLDPFNPKKELWNDTVNKMSCSKLHISGWDGSYFKNQSLLVIESEFMLNWTLYTRHQTGNSTEEFQQFCIKHNWSLTFYSYLFPDM